MQRTQLHQPAPPLRSHAERLIVLTLTAPQADITTVRELTANLIHFLSIQRLTDGLVGLLQRGYLGVEDDGHTLRLMLREPALAWAAYARRPRVHPELN